MEVRLPGHETLRAETVPCAQGCQGVCLASRVWIWLGGESPGRVTLKSLTLFLRAEALACHIHALAVA